MVLHQIRNYNSQGFRQTVHRVEILTEFTLRFDADADSLENCFDICSRWFAFSSEKRSFDTSMSADGEFSFEDEISAVDAASSISWRYLSFSSPSKSASFLSQVFSLRLYREY